MIAEIKKHMEQKTTDELLSIWIKNDREELSNDAFEAVKLILLERGENLPQQVEKTSTAIKPKAPLLWRLLRIGFIVLSLFGGLMMICVVCIAIGSYLRPQRLSNQPLSGMFFAMIMTSAVFLIGGALLSKMASRKTGRQEAKTFTGELIAVIIATAVALVAGPLGFPEFVWGIGSLVAVVGSLYVIFKCKEFRWKNCIIAGLAPGLVFAPIWIPAMMRARDLAFIHQRTETFAQVIAEASSLFTHEDFEAAMTEDHAVGIMPNLNHSVLVLDAATRRLAVSEISIFIPEGLSANQLSSVQVVVVLGEMIFEITPSPYATSAFGARLLGDKELVAPVLVYRWPEQELVFSGKLLTGCTTTSVSRQEVYSLAADSLTRLLQGVN